MSETNVLVVPAVIPSSLEALHTAAATYEFSSEMHVDVVDGQFVPFTSWPHSETDPHSAIANASEILAAYNFEVDLMVTSPLSAARAWETAGASRLVFHIETLSPDELATFGIESDALIGIAANNDTDFAQLVEYAQHADFVQLMGIAEIGAQSQPFDERVLARAAALEQRLPDVPCSVDGSVNTETLPALLKTHIERFVVGSAIATAPDPHQAFQTLQQQVSTSTT